MNTTCFLFIPYSTNTGPAVRRPVGGRDGRKKAARREKNEKELEL